MAGIADGKLGAGQDLRQQDAHRPPTMHVHMMNPAHSCIIPRVVPVESITPGKKSDRSSEEYRSMKKNYESSCTRIELVGRPTED